jgi:hypothetical protein
MTGPLAYIGGKRRVAKQIAAVIAPHRTYIEPFAGGAQVFFQKPPSDVEVLNDLDGEIDVPQDLGRMGWRPIRGTERAHRAPGGRRGARRS